MSWNKPFLLTPAAKDYLWGGNRLNDDFAKKIEKTPLAETWECSTHPDGCSFVATGPDKGRSLAEVLKEHPEYLGSRYEAFGELPILVKFIDAKSDLSVQVHPTDEYAAEKEAGQKGKTEMWYVLDAAKGASIVYGLNRTTDAETLRKAALEGNLEQYLSHIPVEKDDVFFVEAGTIHAIGAGILIAEIQENSNLTYRLYDYNRVDRDGKKRSLHVDKALEVAHLTEAPAPRQPMRVLKYREGVAMELLSSCKYFEVNRMLVNTERRQVVRYRADEMSFRVLLCLSGCGILRWEEETLEIYKGDCIFVPANSIDIRLHGKMQLLDIRA